MEWKISFHFISAEMENGMEWKVERNFFVFCGMKKKWNGSGMESGMENFYKR